MGYILERENGEKTYYRDLRLAERAFNDWKPTDRCWADVGAPYISKPLRIYKGSLLDVAR